MPIRPASVPRNGFTLVEVLVALVVTSLLLAVVMNAAVSARDRAKKSAEKREAILLARTLLTEAAVAPYAQGSRTGTENGLGWQVTEGPAMQDPRQKLVLSEIDVTITSPRGPVLFEIGTRRLKFVPVT